MKKIYSTDLVGFVITLSTLTYALRHSTYTFVSSDPPMHVLHFRLSICDNSCRCTAACAHTNYRNGRLHCELVQRNQTGRSIFFERRIGQINTEQHGRLVSDNTSNGYVGVCSHVQSPICPGLVTDGVTLVLDLDTTGNQWPVQFTNFTWSPGQQGWNTASCAADSQCLASESTMRKTCQFDHDCVDAESECRDGQCWCKPGLSHDPTNMACIQLAQSTIRDACQLDSECVDAESECRDGQCWCKPGLSHDPDSMSCVARSTMTATCRLDSECVAAESECRQCWCKPGISLGLNNLSYRVQSTMRNACQLDSECVDAESECRDEQCWCKPGLSHDPDSLTCVAVCPGPYGSTFQEARYFKRISSGNFLTGYISNVEDCMDKCLRSKRFCTAANYYEAFNRADTCAMLKGPDCTVPVVRYGVSKREKIYLQRDCKSVTDP